jgi:hypothetical protein
MRSLPYFGDHGCPDRQVVAVLEYVEWELQFLLIAGQREREEEEEREEALKMMTSVPREDHESRISFQFDFEQLLEWSLEMKQESLLLVL